MTVKTEGQHPGEHIVSEDNGAGQRSREVVTIAAGADLQPGTVLGAVTDDPADTHGQLDLTDDTGLETAAAVLFGHALAAAAPVKSVVHKRATVVRGSSLIWPAGITTPQKAAALKQLAGRGIIAR